MLRLKTILPVMAALAAVPIYAANLDLRTAVIVIPSTASVQEKKAATMLREEIEKRTQLRLNIQNQPASGSAVILGRTDQVKALAPRLAGNPSKPESFTVAASSAGAPATVAVTGFDDRSVVFGAGYLLRQLHMGRQRLELEPGLNITTAPVVPIRGHQLGYRPKTNAYDAWNVPMWEQYIRELAIFGTNTVELIPPRSDDDADSPHFSLPPIEMMVEMSRIADEYGLDVSIWYPALDKDYSDPKVIDFAVKEWGEVFRRLPRIDAVFVPGGDPGHTQPKYMMALLEKQTANLHKYHPKAQMWMSPQSFTGAWMDEFYSIMKTEPKWLSGIVFGPQNMHDLPTLRQRISSRYPIRFYPDITHMIYAQYPVPEWDPALVLTEGRESINPRPVDETSIFRLNQSYTTGFVTYSEGCNDDVNKFLWSGLGWNPNADPKSILADFSKFFIGEENAYGFAEGLFALERNWRGPLLSNTAVDTTLLQFQELERKATPQLRANWRFQQALYRAYYDAFVRDRLLTETAQENDATGELQRALSTDSLRAMSAAEAILDADRLSPRARDLRARVFELAEGLFQSIRMQLSVPRYRAIGTERGANLDAIDRGLNNRVWFKQRFAEIRTLPAEKERLAKIEAILNWTNPGPGGFYDDLGNVRQQPHLVRGSGFAQDPDYRRSMLHGFSRQIPDAGARLSWFTHAEALFETPLQMRYTGLDPAARYKVKIVYGGDAVRVPVRLMANGTLTIHDFREKPSPVTPLEFDVPQEATQGGTLTLEWTRPAGLGGNGRGAQVAEVWLIRAE